MKFFANGSFLAVLRTKPHNSIEAQWAATQSESLLERRERRCLLYKTTPSILSLGFSLPPSSLLCRCIDSVFYFYLLFLLFVLLSVLIFLVAAEAQPTPLWGTESLNETVGDKEPGSSHTVNNYLWNLKEKHEPCELRGANSLCNLRWAVWTMCLRHWARGRLDPFHITYPAWVPTDFSGFSEV